MENSFNSYVTPAIHPSDTPSTGEKRPRSPLRHRSSSLFFMLKPPWTSAFLYELGQCLREWPGTLFASDMSSLGLRLRHVNVHVSKEWYW